MGHDGRELLVGDFDCLGAPGAGRVVVRDLRPVSISCGRLPGQARLPLACRRIGDQRSLYGISGPKALSVLIESEPKL